jgi:hypothetical protein
MHTIVIPSSSRRFTRLSLVTLGGCALAMLGAAGCSIDDGSGDVEGFDDARSVELAGDATCVTLYAGQTIDVGTVCVSIDNAVDTSAQCGAGSTGAMTVTYATTGGWQLVETHLAAGDQLGDIPVNKAGNPQIGQFPLAGPSAAGSTTASYAVPLCSFGLDGTDEACDPVKSYLAAHAVVRTQNADGTWKSETAWGDGERIVKKGSWAEYFNMTLECKEEVDPPPPPVAACETAFALAGNGDETCFIDADFDGDGTSDGFNRWGWTNGPIAPGTNAQWPVYAAAGQCDLGNGELVGHLSVSYANGSAQVTFDRVEGFTLDEEHLYIGNEPLPRGSDGEYTVAPGQYPVVVELDDATHTTHTVDGLAGNLYVVYHAVACGDFTGDDGGGDDGGDKPVDPLASFDDEFDGDLASWSVHHSWDADYGVSGGQLVVEPHANTVWYAGNEAFQLHKTIPGNFKMTAHVQVTNLAGGPAAPGDPYRIGGIMVRDPLAPDVNSYHMGIGNMAEPVVTIVSKSTNDSVSAIGVQPWDSTVAEMRICRVGVDVQGLIRLPGQSWTIIDWHVRPDLPSTLAAGPISYAFTAAPDLRTSCDWVRYETVATLQDCMLD